MNVLEHEKEAEESHTFEYNMLLKNCLHCLCLSLQNKVHHQNHRIHTVSSAFFDDASQLVYILLDSNNGNT